MFYLYVLAFQDGKHLKIGRTKDLERLRVHNYTFGIDGRKSHIVYGNKDEIFNLEKQILRQTIHFTPQVCFGPVNGLNEIRTIDCLDIVMSMIAQSGLKHIPLSGRLINKMNKPKRGIHFVYS